MKCPKCGHEYQYEGEEYEWEHCPMGDCGYQGSFCDFVVYEHLPPPFYDDLSRYWE